MRSALQTIGDLSALIIPDSLLAEIGAKAGDAVEIEVENGRLVVSRVLRTARTGWAEEGRRLGIQGLSQEEAEWLEAPLSAEADGDWTW